jgi:hypothetical protein
MRGKFKVRKLATSAEPVLAQGRRKNPEGRFVESGKNIAEKSLKNPSYIDGRNFLCPF